MNFKWLACVFAASASLASAQSSKLGDQPYGTWGVDLAARDLTVRPGDDFDAYAGGTWNKNTPIPADEGYTGPYETLRRLVQARLQEIIVESPKSSPVGALYASFLDEPAIDAKGVASLNADLKRVDAVRDKDQFANWLGQSASGFGIRIIDAGGDTDPDDARVMAIGLGQAGLGMPDRDFYLTEQFAPQRKAYRAYIERALAMSGQPDAAAKADAVMAFETAIARVSYSRADRRDPLKSVNRSTFGAVVRDNPGYPWATFMAASGYKVTPTTRIIVGEKDAIRQIAALYASTPLDTLKAWAAFHIADDASPFLPSRFTDSQFLYIKSITGQDEQRSRQRRAINVVDRMLGEAIGRDYVRLYFDPAKKTAMQQLAVNVKAAMRARIARNDWLDPASRATALTKLDRLTVMVGYPDVWRDYSSLKLSPDDLYGNVTRIRAFNQAWLLALLDKPIDRRMWWMTPQTVNAYNSGQALQIVFPAARLQPPFFDLSADPASNYGAIGSIIGHEISHSFDNGGRHIDAEGRFREWWTAKDDTEFKARIAVLGRQYDAFEPLPGLHINGTLTMGENIADVAGLQAALDAYHASLGGKPAPVIDGLTGDQRFFLAYAQARREKQREDDLRTIVTADEHAPSRFRVIGAVRNVDEWYSAFDVKPTDLYYIAPKDRARIW